MLNSTEHPPGKEALPTSTVAGEASEGMREWWSIQPLGAECSGRVAQDALLPLPYILVLLEQGVPQSSRAGPCQ